MKINVVSRISYKHGVFNRSFLNDEIAMALAKLQKVFGLFYILHDTVNTF